MTKIIGTNRDKSGQLSMITGIDLDAVKYKFEGHSSTEIEALLIANYGKDQAPAAKTIRSWFYKQGRLYEFYRAYAASEGKMRRREALDTLRAALHEAVRVLVTLAGKSKSDMVKLLAAKEIINRQLGEPVKPVANLNTKDPAQRILEELGILEAPENNAQPESKQQDS